MRTFATSAVFVAAVATLATLALACGEPRNQRPALNAAPASQPVPQRPFNEPLPQQSTLTPPAAQAPIDQPQSQKPFYGPGTSATDEAKAKTEKPLTDAEVVGAAEAANKGEMLMADVALKKAQSPDVKRFAELMKHTHQKALEGDKKLQEKAKLTGTESDLSTTLKSDTKKVIEDLGDKKGKDFDRAYIDAQVKAHKDVLTAIDDRLLPSAQSREVKTLVTNMRGTVTEHLAKAEEVQKKLDAATTHESKAKVPPPPLKPGKAKAPVPKPAEPILKPVAPEKPSAPEKR